MKVKEVEVCPNCGSPRVEYAATEARSGALLGIGIPEQYYCKDCGYTGSIILEVPKSAIGNINFRRIRKGRSMPIGPKSTEVLKPIYTAVLLVFMFTIFLFLIPRYEVLSGYSGQSTSQLGTSTTQIVTIPTAYKQNQPASQAPGVSYIAVKESALDYVDRALGSDIGTFVVPLFFILFLSGFIMLMIASHWYRIRMFT